MVEIAAGIVLAVAILGLAVAVLVTLPIWLPWLVVGVGLLVALVAVVLTVWGLVYVAQTNHWLWCSSVRSFALLICMLPGMAFGPKRNQTKRQVQRDGKR